MSSAMELTREHLEQIGSYVRDHLGEWIRVVEPNLTVRMDPGYLERMVRIENELKSQRELMQQGFAQMDKRFEQVDRRFEEIRADTNARFEQVDKRFEQVDRRFEEVRADMNARFAQMDKRFEETRADMNARFDDTRHHTNVWMTVLTIVIALASIGGPVIAALVT